MLFPILEKLAIKIFEVGQKAIFSGSKKENRSGFYLGRSPKIYNHLEEENLFLSPEENKGHWYIIGGSGTGKTTLIENCIRYDIVQNKGFCLVDAHGDLSDKIIKFLASLWLGKKEKQKEEFVKRLILVEPFNNERIVGFNPLEISAENSVHASLEMMSVFKARWLDLGPRTEELLRACLVTLCESGLTLLEAPLILTNRTARNSLAGSLSNQEVRDYWLYRYDKLSQGSEAQYREAVLNKLSEFLIDENIRCLLGQTKSTFSFRKVMDESRWIVLNIAKGKLKSNALLLGGLFLAKLQLAGLSRANIPFHRRRAFHIYADEFQNFINARDAGDVETLLSESRKYNLHLTMAHQNLSQLDSPLLNSILGNINGLFCFRLGYKDALTLAPELNPADKNTLPANLIKLNVGEAYMKIKEWPCRLVKIQFPIMPRVHPKVVEEFRESSLFFSARPLTEIKREIEERHQKLKTKNNSTGYRSEGQDGW